MTRDVTWEDKLEARRLIRLGAPDGHEPAPCSCRRGHRRYCFQICEDLVDTIAAALVKRSAPAGFNRDELDEEIPF